MLENKFQRFIQSNQLIKEDERVLLAVSGGVDSMVMLTLFAKYNYNIGVAHCNFMLREEESMEDELMVEQEAKKYNIPYYNIRFQTKEEMARTGESVQMAARRLRYDWFDKICSEHGYDVIAIAHQADDSLETFFINLFRGTGLKGLTGIHRINGRIIRPLLFTPRKAIMDYANSHDVSYREDSSNRSTKYLRNKIRLGITPRMKEINPNFTELMTANVNRLTQAQQFINVAIGRIKDQIVTEEGGVIKIDPQKIDSELSKEFVIYELMNRYGFKGDVVRSLYESLQRNLSGKRFYSREYVAWLDRSMVIIETICEDDNCSVEVCREAQKAYCGNSVLHFEYVDIDQITTLEQPDNIALIDAEKLIFPLVCRKWECGDTFSPLGMNGSKKVSDYLIDTKVSMSEKSRQFVVTSGDDIVWLVDKRIDNRYKITNDCETVLRITREQLQS